MALDSFYGFGIKGYRSYGRDEIQRFGPIDKLHLLAGKNNVGKSNALKFACLILPRIVTGNSMLEVIFPERRDTPSEWGDKIRGFSIALKLNGEARKRFFLPADSSPSNSGEYASSLMPLFASKAFNVTGDGVVWFDYDISLDPNNRVRLSPSREQFDKAMQEISGTPGFSLSELNTRLTGNSSPDDYWNYSTILGFLRPLNFMPQVEWVDAVRQIGDDTTRRAGDDDETVLRHGRGMIKKLASLQSPQEEHYDQDRPKFDALQNFVRAVLEDEGAKIEIPTTMDDILVTTHNRRESYKNLGTGIVEIIHIAAIATITKNALVCIEEPEVHLHPALQRMVLSYLAKSTDNKYLISTHSATMLDSELATICHLSLDDSLYTVSRIAIARKDRAALVADLGNQASDIVQSNYLIWVEGPSDRIYINHWIHLVEPTLIEGVHYSIMFYGGGLLNHLTASDDQEVSELIELIQINRNFSIVIDSDKSGIDDTLNDTKSRVISEVEKSGAYVWVTDGYTIENYVPHSEIVQAIKGSYPKKEYDVKESVYVSPLGMTFGATSSKPNKVTIAKAIVNRQIGRDEWPGEVLQHTSDMVKAINKANSFSS